jgi:biotin carboxylase
MSLEELILRQVVAEPTAPVRELSAAIGANSEAGAAGVMMIPIPRRGIYQGVAGLDAAQSVPGVTGVTITAQPGQMIAPPPDAASYLGFIFARAAQAASAEAALRSAHRCLRFDIRPEYAAKEVRSAL